MTGALDWVTAGIFSVVVILCTVRGFTKSVSGTVKIFGSYLAARFLGPSLGAVISEHVIGDAVYGWLESKITALAGTNLSVLFFERQEGFRMLLKRFGASDQFDSLKLSYGDAADASENVVSQMVRDFASPWIDRFSVVVACVAVFVAAFLLLFLLTKLLVAMIERFRLLKRTDRILGFVLGVLAGVLSVVGMCYVLSLFVGVLAFFGGASDPILSAIEDASVFGYIYRLVIGTL